MNANAVNDFLWLDDTGTGNAESHFTKDHLCKYNMLYPHHMHLEMNYDCDIPLAQIYRTVALA